MNNIDAAKRVQLQREMLARKAGQGDVVAHEAAQGKAASQVRERVEVEPNPDRTYVSQSRVRLYVATPRGNA